MYGGEKEMLLHRKITTQLTRYKENDKPQIQQKNKIKIKGCLLPLCHWPQNQLVQRAVQHTSFSRQLIVWMYTHPVRLASTPTNPKEKPLQIQKSYIHYTVYMYCAPLRLA